MSKIFYDSEGNKYEQCSPMDAPSYYVIKPIKAEENVRHILEFKYVQPKGKDGLYFEKNFQFTLEQGRAVSEAIKSLTEYVQLPVESGDNEANLKPFPEYHANGGNFIKKADKARKALRDGV